MNLTYEDGVQIALFIGSAQAAGATIWAIKAKVYRSGLAYIGFFSVTLFVQFLIALLSWFGLWIMLASLVQSFASAKAKELVWSDKLTDEDKEALAMKWLKESVDKNLADFEETA